MSEQLVSELRDWANYFDHKPSTVVNVHDARFADLLNRAASELAASDDRAKRNSDALREGLKIPGEDRRLFPVYMERSMGASFAWLVWAVKPGAVRLIAICSTEARADQYAANLPPGLSDFKSWKERAPVDHSFGFADSMHARVQGKIA